MVIGNLVWFFQVLISSLVAQFIKKADLQYSGAFVENQAYIMQIYFWNSLFCFFDLYFYASAMVSQPCYDVSNFVLSGYYVVLYKFLEFYLYLCVEDVLYFDIWNYFESSNFFG